jgi:ketosteroid isomerase-like protein
MSRENVELGRRTIDAFNRRDLDALLALVDEDVEGVPTVASIEGNYHGHAGIRRWWESVFEGLPDFTVEILEERDLGDLTVGFLGYRAHGAASDAPVEQRFWLIARWHKRKVVWWQTFRSEAEALEAEGLRE